LKTLENIVSFFYDHAFKHPSSLLGDSTHVKPSVAMHPVSPDDDVELEETPEDVVAMLGFDTKAAGLTTGSNN
jgi:hypothetical protein